jgi:hypothetical protein
MEVLMANNINGATLLPNGAFRFDNWARAEAYIPELRKARIAEEDYPDDVGLNEGDEYMGIQCYQVVIYPANTPTDLLPKEVDGEIPEDTFTSIDGEEWLIYGYLPEEVDAFALDYGRLDPWGPAPSWDHN